MQRSQLWQHPRASLRIFQEAYRFHQKWTVNDLQWKGFYPHIFNILSKILHSGQIVYWQISCILSYILLVVPISAVLTTDHLMTGTKYSNLTYCKLKFRIPLWKNNLHENSAVISCHDLPDTVSQRRLLKCVVCFDLLDNYPWTNSFLIPYIIGQGLLHLQRSLKIWLLCSASAVM